MNILNRNMKKAAFTIVLFLTSIASFADHCFPGDPPVNGVPCDTDVPLDTHILILMLFVAIFAIYTINKKSAKILIAQ